jgi:hypothetical protein
VQELYDYFKDLPVKKVVLYSGVKLSNLAVPYWTSKLLPSILTHEGANGLQLEVAFQVLSFLQLICYNRAYLNIH